MNRIKKLTALVSVLALSSVASYGISHGNIAIDNSGGSSLLFNGIGDDLMLGYTFTTTGMTLNAVGIFDVGSDGLNSDHRVGIWNSGGALIVDQVVSTGGSVSASASALGRWVSTGLAGGSQYIGAGTYTVAGYFDNTSGDAVVVGAAAINSVATYGAGRYKYTGTFEEPLQNYNPNEEQYFGPGLFASVPDTGSSLALLGLGFIGLVGFRRRFSK